ncbi:MAG: GNAT family N-acetyltransferase [Bacteroidota bacterium]
MLKIQKVNLFSEVFESRSLPHCYTLRNQDSKAFSTLKHRENECSKNIYSIRLVPPHFNLTIKDNQQWRFYSIPQYNWGYAIFLESFTNTEEYLEKQFKANFRKVIKRYVSRLEGCFDIRYHTFYGEIEQEEYDILMGRLHLMVKRRFSQKGERHLDLHKWDTLKKDGLQLINEKKASLFVIYQNNEPIEISLNYHYDQILFSAISSYNTAYSKFGLGHVEIYKQLDWCFRNGFTIFEMGVGGMDYKRRWSNSIYRFAHHIIFKNNKLIHFIPGAFELLRVKCKEYLKSKGLNEIHSKIRLPSPKKTQVPTLNFLKKEEPNMLNLAERSNPVDRADDILTKSVCDFLYLHKLHLSQIKVYLSKEMESYWIWVEDEKTWYCSAL